MNEPTRICPICKSDLNVEILDGISIDHCHLGCGTFLDKDELKDVVHPILDEKNWTDEKVCKFVLFEANNVDFI